MATESSGTSDHIPMPDFTSLKSPLQLGGTGLGQLLQCYQVGTDEIRETLMHECDIIVECKVCRSLYRGLPNFLAHKKSYCSNKFTGSLLRFHDMTTKEDEAFVFGSSTFQEEDADEDEEVHFGRKSRGRRRGADTPFSRIHSFFKQIHKAGENVAKARSTDHILELNTMEESGSVVTQSISSAKKVLEGLGDQVRKRKVEESQHAGGSPVNPRKILKVSDENFDVQPQEKGLNGVLANKVGQVTSLKQLFISQNMCAAEHNRCLKCNTDFSTNKGLKIHLKRRHMKRRSFNQCRNCSKLYIHNDSFVQHLKDDHGLARDNVMQQIMQPKVEKVVLDNLYVFDNFDLKPGGKGRCTVRESDSPKSSQKLDESGNKDDNNIWANNSIEASHHSENEDDAGSDDPDGVRRVQYLCTKTFWLSIVDCLGLYERGPLKSRLKYTCRGHPNMVFNLYTSYKDHILHQHIPKIIQCPVCKQSFQKPVHKYFTNFAVHLKTAHHITEMNITKLQKGLREYVLHESMSNSETETFDVPEPEGRHGTDNVPEDTESQDEMADNSEEKGQKKYRCIKCDKTSTAYWALRIHMMQAHELSHEDCMAARKSIQENAIIQPRRQINRRQAINLEGGIMSVFNLDDFSCPLCHRTYPKLGQVISHLMCRHGQEKEEAEQYKAEIKESRRQQQQQNTENLAGMGRANRAKHTSGDDHKQEDKHPQVSSKRKQFSPSKSDSYTFKPNLATYDPEVGSTSTKITFKSGFSLHSCPKCHKVFGQRSALEVHERLCLREDEDTSMLTSDSVCEEGVDTSSQMIQSPPGSSILKSMLKTRFPTLVCRKCNKHFHKKVARASHESRCMGRSGAGGNTDSSDDVEEENMDENKNCDKDNGSDSEALCKVYKCPLCDFEDLELHKISHHLVVEHEWSQAKVATRRDTLKRSVVLKQSHKLHTDSDGGERESLPSNRKVASPRSKVSQNTSASAPAPSDMISPMTLSDYQCHLCPRVYWEMGQLCNHWSAMHNLGHENIQPLKKEAIDRKKKQLAEFQVLPRQARRTLVDTSIPKKQERTTLTEPEQAKHGSV